MGAAVLTISVRAGIQAVQTTLPRAAVQALRPRPLRSRPSRRGGPDDPGAGQPAVGDCCAAWAQPATPPWSGHAQASAWLLLGWPGQPPAAAWRRRARPGRMWAAGRSSRAIWAVREPEGGRRGHARASFDVPPTVAETKLNFLKSYKRPIPSIYSTVLQELLVQQHLMRYKRTYQYDPVFGLGFVTVYDQLMEGYPSNEDKDSIFRAYITALNEDPDQYRADALKMEEWARSQNISSLVDFSSRDGEIEAILKDISERAKGTGNFSYSRFFAVGLFRLLELANATEPTVLDKLCAALNVSKRSVDRDLDVYRNILSKLVQAKELLKEYVDREKKKREERSETLKPNEAVTKFDGNLYSIRH